MKGFRKLGEPLFSIGLTQRSIGETFLTQAEYWQQAINALGRSNILGYFPTWDLSGVVADEIVNNRDGAYLATTVLGAVGIGDGRTSANVNASGGLDMYSAALAAAWSPDIWWKSFWVAPTLAGYWADNTQHHMAISAASATMYYVLRKNTDNSVNLISRRGGTIVSVSVDPPTTARWVYYLLMGETTNDRITLFVNGARLPRSTATLGAWAGALGATFCRVGNTSPGFGLDPFPGRVAHCIEGGVALPSDSAVKTVSRSVGQVVFVGDSRSNTAKQWTSAAVEAAFPSGLRAYGGRGYSNWAVTGYGWVDIQNNAANIDALLGSGTNTLVAWAGVNNGGENAAQIYARISAYCAARRVAGWKVIICSEIDSQADMTWHNTTWPALNALLAADHSFADGYADLGSRVELQNALDLTYYNADKTHLTTAGYAIVRNVLTPVIASVAA